MKALYLTVVSLFAVAAYGQNVRLDFRLVTRGTGEKSDDANQVRQQIWTQVEEAFGRPKTLSHDKHTIRYVMVNSRKGLLRLYQNRDDKETAAAPIHRTKKKGSAAIIAKAGKTERYYRNAPVEKIASEIVAVDADALKKAFPKVKDPIVMGPLMLAYTLSYSPEDMSKKLGTSVTGVRVEIRLCRNHVTNAIVSTTCSADNTDEVRVAMEKTLGKLLGKKHATPEDAYLKYCAGYFAYYAEPEKKREKPEAAFKRYFEYRAKKDTRKAAAFLCPTTPDWLRDARLSSLPKKSEKTLRVHCKIIDSENVEVEYGHAAENGSMTNGKAKMYLSPAGKWLIR